MKTNDLYIEAVAKGFETDTIDDSFITLCKIQKWLMDEHNIYVMACPLFDRFSCFVANSKKGGMNFGSGSVAAHNTWLGAFEAGIEKALSLINI